MYSPNVGSIYPIYKCIFYCILLKGPLCNELGRQCISKIGSFSSSCLTPCKGIYADVKRTPFTDAAGFSMNALHDNYSRYKRFQEEEIEFPSALQGYRDLTIK